VGENLEKLPQMREEEGNQEWRRQEDQVGKRKQRGSRNKRV
jgi:hypothetical protein